MITFTNISAINLYYPSLVYLYFCAFGTIFTDIRVITPLLYSGKSVALLITLTPWAWFSDWKDGKLKHRGDDYNALKDKIGSQMWKQTEELFPQLAGTVCYFVCLFCCFTSQVNSYGHAGAVSSPNHTFLGKLEQAVNQYFVHILLLVTDNNPS